MEGVPSLWVPGTDHAGIATQNVVEKELLKEGKTRHDLGKEKFVQRVWQWKEKYGHIIIDQLKAIGCSCDWSREVFTMDPDYIAAVNEVFRHYFEKGWIYQGERCINWCTRCSTSLSDLEIAHNEERAQLYYIKYGPLTIATVRPETKVGDTAVAVNPKDPRYKRYLGRIIEIQTVLGPAKMKVVADESIDMEFGTGAMKVTPAHDLHDFELGEKYGLEKRQVIGPDGKMNKLAGKYEGLTVVQARQKIIEDMQKIGILERTEPYTHNVALCYRCGTVLEPILSKQWFLKMEDLTKPAIKVAKEGKIKFIPTRWKKVYLDWLENIKDWCISRQIWWGIQIPVWYCGPQLPYLGFHESVIPQVMAGKTKTYRLRDHNLKIGNRVAFRNSQTKILFGYGEITAVEYTTVGQLPLDDQTHGATYKTRHELLAAFKKHHPQKEINSATSVVVYAYQFSPFDPKKAKGGCGQIIVSGKKPERCLTCGQSEYFSQDPDTLDTWFSSALWPFVVFGWPEKTKDFNYFYPTTVLSTARDIIYLWVARMVFSGLEFTGEVPFSQVYIHPTIFTKEGKRMSKSLGTGVDPLGLVEKYGADATRFGLMYQNTGTQDIKFSEETIVASRNFCNKIWNAARFILSHPKPYPPNPIPSRHSDDKWIIGKLEKTVNNVTTDLDRFRFGQAAHTLYDFFWHDFCDKYLEMSKKRRDEAQPTLIYVLEKFLKLLHPFMPFITEEIYQRLPGHGKSIMIEGWPKS